MSIAKSGAFLLFLCASALLIRADWPSFGGGPRRDGWNRAEDTFTKDNVKGLTLQWKLKVENTSLELNALTAPVVMEGVITPHGFKEYVIVAGSSDTLFAIDADTGKLVWKKAFQVDKTKLPKSAFWLCPNAQNATPAVNHWEDKHLPNNTVFALASDGKLHGLNVNDGEDKFPPTQFTPPYGKPWSLNIHDGVIYTTTSQDCNDTRSGVWAMDFRTPDHKVTFIPATHAHGAGSWGRGGAAIGKDRLFAETGDSRDYDPEKGNYPDSVLGIALATNTLVDYYTPADRSFITRKDLDMGNMTPAVFDYKGRELVAAAGKQGLIYLLDAKKLGGDDHRTPLFRSPLYTNEGMDFAGHGFWGAFATWQDPSGTRWLYAPAIGPVASQAPPFAMKNGDTPHGSIMAFKVEDKDGKPALTSTWISRDMNVPEPPVIANGVVFAISNGEFTGQAKPNGGLYSSKERADLHSGNAVLYAFDAATGKELFSSGNTIESFTHFSGVAVASGHVLVSTYNNTVYSFGLKEQ